MATKKKEKKITAYKTNYNIIFTWSDLSSKINKKKRRD